MRICFIGDSFVNGTGDPDCQGWTGRVCSQARYSGRDITHYNLGIRGNTSDDIRLRWHREATARLPDDIDGRLVFSFGANDCVIESGRQRVHPDETIMNTREILVLASQWKPTLFIGPPPLADDGINLRLCQLSTRLEDTCQEVGVPYLDLLPSLSADDLWMREVAAYDGAHPSRLGYTRLAEMVGRWSAWQHWR